MPLPAYNPATAKHLYRTTCKCYDCGSHIAGHHSQLCEMAPPRCTVRLPANCAQPGTQWLKANVQALQLAATAANIPAPILWAHYQTA